MFWSGNYIACRELNFLLKEENVTLTQVLEADDILQECKADNKALICFLTKPEILAELINLILEEPPQDVELSVQYRHANIASEVLTSDLSMLSNQLSMDVAQMNKICDFVKKDPPLNPLLASYFSKTIGMLLEQGPKQGWCLYNIVCLRALDFFRARRDFLPNLLRHMSTSAIADTFKYFIKLENPFNKIVMEWFEEHQFLESLIHIICGAYDPPEVQYDPVVAVAQHEGLNPPEPEAKPEPNQVEQPEEPEKAQQEYAEKLDNQSDIEKQNRIDNRPATGEVSLDRANGNEEPEAGPEAEHDALRRCQLRRDEERAGAAKRSKVRAARLRAVAADNSASLLCVLLANAAGLACDFGSRQYFDLYLNSQSKAVPLAARLRSGDMVRALLSGMFTASGPARRAALVGGTRVLRALLTHDFTPEPSKEIVEVADIASVELAIAPHIPLLHHALLRDPARELDESPEDGAAEGGGEAPAGCSGGGGGEGGAGGGEGGGEGSGEGGGEGGGAGRVGAARLGAAALLSQLACSEVDDVPNALISLGTASVLASLAWRHEHNNFLHAELLAFVRNALANPRHSHRYAVHLIEECKLLENLMDLYYDNDPILLQMDQQDGESKFGKPAGRRVRAGYMGHVIQMLRCFDELASPPPLEASLEQNWLSFRVEELRPLLKRHDLPLCGFFPSDTHVEVNSNEEEEEDDIRNYDYAEADAEGPAGGPGGLAGGPAGGPAASDAPAGDDSRPREEDVEKFLELANQRFDMWGDDAPEATPLPLNKPSPWESASSGAGGERGERGEGGEGGGSCGGECWANFGEPFEPDDEPDFEPPFQPSVIDFDFNSVNIHFWPFDIPESAQHGSAEGLGGLEGLEGPGGLQRLRLRGDEELANNLRAAMSELPPDQLANIVNANMTPAPPSPPPSPPPRAPSAPPRAPSPPPASPAPAPSAPAPSAPAPPAPPADR